MRVVCGPLIIAIRDAQSWVFFPMTRVDEGGRLIGLPKIRSIRAALGARLFKKCSPAPRGEEAKR